MMNEKMYKDRMSKNIPVMETTIEGAQKRIAKAIEDYADRCEFIGDPCETSPDLEYIAVFLDTVGDEMAAISSAYNSLHERYVQSIAASTSSIHAANDNR